MAARVVCSLESTLALKPDRPAIIAGTLAIIAAAALWGTTGTTQALLPPDREPMVVAALRLIIGAATLAVLSIVAASPAVHARLPLPLIIAAGGAIGLYNVLFFTAVTKAGVGIGTALAIGSAPVWVGLYDRLVLGIHPGVRILAGQGVSIVGASLLAAAGTSAAGGTGASIAGIALALGAGAAYAAYSLLTSRVDPRVPSTTLAATTFAVAAVLCAPALMLWPIAWALGARPLLLLASLGVIATGLSYALYTWGLRSVPTSTAVTLALVEPLTAWVLATVVIGEAITVPKAAGAALLLLGLWIVTDRPSRSGSHTG
jgi:drug/metabolite transporter, DME family